MNPVTAICFLLAGTSLLLAGDETSERRHQGFGAALGALVFLAAGLKLAGLALSVQPGIDQLLYRGELSSPDGLPPNRMAPNTAAAFLLLGAALVALHLERPGKTRASQWLLVVPSMISIMAIIGYAYEQEQLYGVVTFIPMAVNTAIAFFALCLGVLFARTDTGLSALLASDGLGGSVARRLLPAGILVPFLIGWIRLYGQRAGYFDLSTAVVMMTLATIATFTALVWITARMLERVDAERRHAHAFLDSIVEEMPAMVFVKDARELRFVRFNRAGEELLGYSREDLLGKNDYDLFPKHDADSFTSADRAVLAKGGVLDVAEEPIQTRSRGQRLLHTRKVPILDAAGGPQYLLGISEDITERRRSEKEILALNERLKRQADQLEFTNKELETFSYSVSHDLRAPIRHIAGFTDLLGRRCAAAIDEEGKRLIERISSSASRMGRLIDDLLLFSKAGRAAMSRTLVDLGSVIAGLVEQVRPDIAGRQVEWRIDPLPDVEGDPSLLALAFSNLISNAVKYTGTRASARIEIGAEETERENVVFVRDNGVGFDMQYAEKLFGVFQRLHSADEFEGTGIGLANVRRIVTRHGGIVWAESAVDQGATFYVALPKAMSQEAA
jgi:PAS domain S-box-containing protein